MTGTVPPILAAGPKLENRTLFFGGAWQEPLRGAYTELTSPGTGLSLGRVAKAGPDDVDNAVAAALAAQRLWKRTAPAERAAALRKAGAVLRDNADELAYIEAVDSGNPIVKTRQDVISSATALDFFAGLVTEMKGNTIPMGPNLLNLSVREPLGIVAKIGAFNHPLMFCVRGAAAPLAAGNSVILKPADQAPLSTLRFAELVAPIFPPGVLNVLPGNAETGAALAAHRDIAKIALTGSVKAGRAVLEAAAPTLKAAALELGGKNALIAFPDTDPRRVARAIVEGMNFIWCGQSCGSTSRAFIHSAIHDEVVEEVRRLCMAIRPGPPVEASTKMGALISEAHLRNVLRHVDIAVSEGATLLCGGRRIEEGELKDGCFMEPTVFVGVDPQMRIAREEIFGPVLAILEWSDREEMLGVVNDSSYGLTCSIWTNDLMMAHRTAMDVEVGYVWVNNTSQHFLGAPFGGYKNSGRGREECLEELISYTQEKNININLLPA